MSERFTDSQSHREALSALADGQASSDDVAKACASWREDGQSRAAWQAYHLIGDVMRSEELAEGTASADFLNRFRDRLAKEPVVLAPVASQAVAAQQLAPVAAEVLPLKRRSWTAPFAVAASFVAIVSAAVSWQFAENMPAGGGADQMAQAPATPSSRQDVGGADAGLAFAATKPNVLQGSGVQQGTSVANQGGSFSRPEVAGLPLIRDPQVDQMLANLPRHVTGGDSPLASQDGLAHAAVPNQGK